MCTIKVQIFIEYTYSLWLARSRGFGESELDGWTVRDNYTIRATRYSPAFQQFSLATPRATDFTNSYRQIRSESQLNSHTVVIEEGCESLSLLFSVLISIVFRFISRTKTKRCYRSSVHFRGQISSGFAMHR